MLFLYPLVAAFAFLTTFLTVSSIEINILPVLFKNSLQTIYKEWIDGGCVGDESRRLQADYHPCNGVERYQWCFLDDDKRYVYARFPSSRSSESSSLLSLPLSSRAAADSLLYL